MQPSVDSNKENCCYKCLSMPLELCSLCLYSCHAENVMNSNEPSATCADPFDTYGKCSTMCVCACNMVQRIGTVEARVRSGVEMPFRALLESCRTPRRCGGIAAGKIGSSNSKDISICRMCVACSVSWWPGRVLSIRDVLTVFKGSVKASHAHSSTVHCRSQQMFHLCGRAAILLGASIR